MKNNTKRQAFMMLSLATLMAQPMFAQRAMTVQDITDFQRISFKQISNNGQFILSVTEPWRGDGDRNGNLKNFSGDATAKIFDTKGNLLHTFGPISNIGFTAGSSHVVLSTKITEKEREEILLNEQNAKNEKPAARPASGTPIDARGQKSKPAATSKDLPMDKLVIYQIGGSEEIIDSLRSYKLAEKADWLAYQTGKKDSTLYVRPLTQQATSYTSVTSYQFSTDGKSLAFVAAGSGVNGTCGLFLLQQGSATPTLIKEGKGNFKGLTFAKEGSSLAFMYAEKPAKGEEDTKGMELWMSKQGAPAHQVLASAEGFAPKGWIISENGRLKFSDNEERLTFGTAPAPRQKDKSVLAANRPDVQVWSWDEPVQYTVQDYNKDRDSKKTYTAVLDLVQRKPMQVADENLPNAVLTSSQDGEYALLSTSEPYSKSSMWEGRTRNDYYSLNLKTGEKKLLSKADYARYRVSPAGKYAYGYNETDSIWRTIDMQTGEVFQLTNPQSFQAWDNTNDVPDYARACGDGGWTANDESIFLYDNYDIYQVSARGGELKKWTVGGNEDKIRYRFALGNSSAYGGGEEKARDLKEVQLLTAWNEHTKGYAYYSLNMGSKKKAAPTLLMGGNYMLGALTKAKDAKTLMFTKETYENYPELYVSDYTFKAPQQITHEGDQQNAFLWGTAELISWTSYKGVKLEGIIYKPANFDPNKKYPLLVNFYERNAETLYSYHLPQPHRSTLDYHLYNSNEYIIFNPDIIYTDGHPGESCYDCVMSGIDEVLKRGYVDEKRIGAGGHSWGGYQTAYLATRTNRFACLESGAPVVNMFSAFGGIRWGSGLARDFQYEHGQSRIGKSIWEAPELYKENSPLFNMDKVQTPLLIMHNDTDGHVPWYQGIEYAVALKRLNKVYWMLNYTGEPHWPVRMANRMDFQTRMKHFFDHYLKGTEMPKWMKEGVKAVDQPYELGY